jgi:hypothetical protein
MGMVMAEIRVLDTNAIIDAFGRTSYNEANGLQLLNDWKSQGHVLTSSTVEQELNKASAATIR